MPIILDLKFIKKTFLALQLHLLIHCLASTMATAPNVNTCLKKAREAVDKKDWPDVVKWARTALNQDKSCYGAYVLYGLAAVNTPGQEAQAEQAYRKASSLDPMNPLAWKGLLDLAYKQQQWNEVASACETLLQHVSVLYLIVMQQGLFQLRH